MKQAVAKLAKLGIYQACALILTGVVKVLFRTRFAGRENIPPHGAIVVSRHRSFWDVPLAVAALHWCRCVTFVARKTLMQEHFWLKPFIAAYAIPVDREHFRMSDFKNVMQAINTNQLVAIFPEGTIKQTGEVFPGVIRFAERSGREILPVRLKVRVGHYPPKYPFGFPALTVMIGKPFTLRDLEFDLTGEETREQRYQRLSQLLIQRINTVDEISLLAK